MMMPSFLFTGMGIRQLACSYPVITTQMVTCIDDLSGGVNAPFVGRGFAVKLLPQAM
jgi:hypothetical protein